MSKIGKRQKDNDKKTNNSAQITLKPEHITNTIKHKVIPCTLEQHVTSDVKLH